MADTSPPTPSEESVRKLAELGLTWDLLWHSIKSGETQRQQATTFEPRPAAGLRDWIGRVGSLRRQLADEGWQRISNHQIPLSVNTSRTVGVGVLLGNSITGCAWTRDEPRSMYEKGPHVLNLGDANALFPVSQARPDLLGEEDSHLQTWFLMTYRHIAPSEPRGGPDEAEVLSELSLPGSSDSGTHLDSWLDRIYLPPTRFALPSEDGSEGNDDGGDMGGLSDLF